MRTGSCVNCGCDLPRNVEETSAFCSQACYDEYVGCEDGIVVISFGRYGDECSFATVEEAEREIRNCGDAFAGVTLCVVGDSVFNEADERVGFIR